MEPKYPDSRRSGLTLPAVHPDAWVRTPSWPSVVGSHASHCDQARVLSLTTANIGKSTRQFDCRTSREFTDEFRKPSGWTVGSHANCPAHLVFSFQSPMSRDTRVSHFLSRFTQNLIRTLSNTVRFPSRTSSIQFIHSTRNVRAAILIVSTEAYAAIRVTDGVVVLATTCNPDARGMLGTVRIRERVRRVTLIVITHNGLRRLERIKRALGRTCQANRSVYDAWRGDLQNTKKSKDSVNDALIESNDSSCGSD